MTIKPKKILLHIGLLTFLLLLSRTLAHAVISNPVIGDLGTPENTADGGKFIGYSVYLWRSGISLGALVVIAYFIWGAFEWITAGSDSKKTETARSRMTNAIIGLVLMVTSFTLLSFISKILFDDNFDLMRLTFPSINESGPNGGLPLKYNATGGRSGINN